MRNYELTLILAKEDEEKLNEVIQNIISLVQNKGGLITHEDRKGWRTLLSPIKKQDGCFLVLLRFTIDSEKVLELEKALKEMKAILRFLITSFVARKTKGKVLAPALTPLVGAQIQREERETEKVELGDIDKRLEEIFKNQI